MPRSKRNKVVNLTKTSSKGRSLKSKMVDLLRDSLDEYSNLFAFTFENMRATKFKDVRMDWRESRYVN
jgi:mRNA turnover protein 4